MYISTIYQYICKYVCIWVYKKHRNKKEEIYMYIYTYTNIYILTYT